MKQNLFLGSKTFLCIGIIIPLLLITIYQTDSYLDIKSFILKELNLIRNITYLIIFLLMILAVYIIKLRKELKPPSSKFSYRVTPD